MLLIAYTMAQANRFDNPEKCYWFITIFTMLFNLKYTDNYFF
jgi:hypothetical protein